MWLAAYKIYQVAIPIELKSPFLCGNTFTQEAHLPHKKYL